jgi:outer membrane protein assembly factor BamB
MPKMSAFLLAFVAIPLVADWPSFRGPNASGVAANDKLPDKWDGEKSQNLRWKTPIPGSGLGSPIVSKGRIYLLTAVRQAGESDVRVRGDNRADPVKDEGAFTWRLISIRLRDGKILWIRDVHDGVPRSVRVTGSTYANSTPATDGKHIVVTIANEAVLCLDLDGKVLWKKELGLIDPKGSLDPSSSPLIVGNRVIVQCDWQTDGYLAALDIGSGRELWRVPRNEGMGWSTPAVSGSVVVTSSSKWVRGYEVESGKEVWKFNHPPSRADRIPSPVVTPEWTYVSGGGPEGSTVAISARATGEVKTGTPEFGWTSRTAPYLATPLVYGEYLYNLYENGVLRVLRTATGERVYEQRVTPSRFTASPIVVGDRILLTDEEGTNYVIAPGPVYKLIQQNAVGEPCMATPAIADKTLVVRTIHNLYAFREKG